MSAARREQKQTDGLTPLTSFAGFSVSQKRKRDSEATPPEPQAAAESAWDVDMPMPDAGEPAAPPAIGLTLTLLGRDPTDARWVIVKEALSRPIAGGPELVKAITACGGDAAQDWDLGMLEYYLEHGLEKVVKPGYFFESVLPWMCSLVLDTHTHLRDPVPLLRQGVTGSWTCDELQAAALLAHCFFCVVPNRHAPGARRGGKKGGKKKGGKGAKSGARSAVATEEELLAGGFANANFLPLFTPPVAQVQAGLAVEKLHCFVQYFVSSYERLARAGTPPTRLQVIRTAVQDFPDWKACTVPLQTRLSVDESGCIESKIGCLQVDFANRYLGGGVIGNGCVQEEIRFLMTPGLMLARLVCECLSEEEAVRVIGCRQYSTYTGYSDTFCYVGPYDDPTPNVSGPKASLYCNVCVVAADAVNFNAYGMYPSKQFSGRFQKREVNKMYAAVSGSPSEQEAPISRTLATGKWGCGVFGGDAEFKALLQLCAAAAAGCEELIFHTYGDINLAAKLALCRDHLAANPPMIGELYRALSSYAHDSNQSAIEHVMKLL
ncbi:Poly(ADP-ribose) glycohydrolase [Diplonema papillatum]|nr:Poly(ADP-ribose) glycohydrolase [Diplonema papillatum]